MPKDKRALARPGREDAGAKPASRPLYQQVKDHLIHRVLTGEWKPGECLPSEFRLADEYGLSQGTVRKAIEEMANEQLVTRRAGKGTFVTSHSGDYKPFKFHGFFNDAGNRVAEGETVYIECRPCKANQRLASGLGIIRNDPVSEIIRLRRFEGPPAVLEKTYLSEELCPGAHTLIWEQQPNSIYLVLEQVYNLLITKVDERLRARSALADEAEMLMIPPDSPVLEVERTAYSLGGEPVEWRTMVCETSKFYYRNRIG